MKRVVATSVLTLVGAFVACTPEEPDTVGDQGVGGTVPNGGVAGNGMNGGNAGNGMNGGNAGNGMNGGNAGNGMNGGNAGNGVGGNAGNGVGGTPPAGAGGGPPGGDGGGPPAGAGGMPPAGAGGMPPAGAGGMPPAGAGGGGAGGMAGKAGAGGAGGSPMCPTPAELFPVAQVTGQTSGLTGTANPAGAMGSLEGHLIFTPCADTACDDCSGAGWVYKGTTTGCSNGLTAVQNFTVGGTPGTPYNVTLHFYGINEPKNYGNQVTRASGTQRPGQQDTGANPNGWAYATGNPNFQMSDYNTYELHIVDNNGMEVCSYFLNSDTAEGHWTYVINYEKTITVIGGGRVRVRVYDRNCRMIKNCMSGGTQGACNTNGCNNKARTVDTSAANPQPMGLMQPGLGNDTNQAGQWLFIDVTQVACAARLGCNGMPM